MMFELRVETYILGRQLFLQATGCLLTYQVDDLDNFISLPQVFRL